MFCKSICILGVVGIVLVVGQSQTLGSFQKEVCWTPTPSLLNHGGGQSTHTILEEVTKEMASKVQTLEARIQEMQGAKQTSYERLLFMILLLAIGGSSSYLLYNWIYLGTGKRLGIKVMLYRSLRQSVDPDDESEKDEVPITRSSVTVTRTPVSVASRPVSTNDNPLGIKCLICKGKHFNLVQCKQLMNFIPYEGAVTKVP